MASRRLIACEWLLASAIALTACSDATVEVALEGQVHAAIELAADGNDPPVGSAEYRWTVEGSPADSTPSLYREDQPAATFRADVEGTYVVERRMLTGASTTVTHRFTLILVNQVPPTASIRGDSLVAVGDRVELDGSSSQAVEDRPLSFHWRMATRPRGSAAELTTWSDAQTSFLADASGTYVIELTVFDGVVWSAPDTVSIRAL